MPSSHQVCFASRTNELGSPSETSPIPSAPFCWSVAASANRRPRRARGGLPRLRSLRSLRERDSLAGKENGIPRIIGYVCQRGKRLISRGKRLTPVNHLLRAQRPLDSRVRKFDSCRVAPHFTSRAASCPTAVGTMSATVGRLLTRCGSDQGLGSTVASAAVSRRVSLVADRVQRQPGGARLSRWHAPHDRLPPQLETTRAAIRIRRGDRESQNHRNCDSHASAGWCTSAWDGTLTAVGRERLPFYLCRGDATVSSLACIRRPVRLVLDFTHRAAL